MKLREVELHEREAIFQTGYTEWPRGRTYEQYIMDNSKEDDYGRRYALVDQNDMILGSIIILDKQINQAPVFGLGSVVIEKEFRNQGYGITMLQETLKIIDEQEKDSITILYSEINPEYYAKLGFRELPSQFQRYNYASLMVRCSQKNYEMICTLPIEAIPTHF